MTDPRPESPDAAEAEDMGERPDRGRAPDALIDALSGSGVGSDTRAGSLRGGAATGSDDDLDQRAVDHDLAERGRAAAKPPPSSGPGPDAVANTGIGPGETADAVEDDDADAATG